VNPHRIPTRAKFYESEMVRFLRDIIAIPSESGDERRVIARIRKEMKATKAFDKVWTDPMGNLFARIGRGKHAIAVDAHCDTVGIADSAEWRHDPYKGKVARGRVWGRGSGDQKGAIPAMVYAARIIRDLDIPLDQFTLTFVVTVMEEDCDGLCWQYIVKEDGFRPDVVVITDSTNCQIFRGQRGRMEIGVTATGRSCHGSMPHKGDNAVYKIARIARELERLSSRLARDRFLGDGTLTVSYVDCKTPSLCAVPNHAYLHIDRRLTAGETKAEALRQIREAIRRAGVRAKVSVPIYDRPSYTGLAYPAEKYFPTWIVDADALPVAAAARTYQSLFRRKPRVHRWTFSTNAVAISGRFGIPCVGFGPAPESVAHTVDDSVPIRHMVEAAAFYAAFPGHYCLAAGEGRRAGRRAKA